MTQLFSPVPLPPADLGLVAVAIKDDASHLALLFRLQSHEPLNMLHLAWDHDLRKQEVTAQITRNYLATTLAIGPLRSKAVAHYSLMIFEANYSEGIPYAFGNPAGSFDDDGRFVVAEKRVGLTCASFVVAVLEQAGVNIVEREGWGPNSDDEQFFRWIVSALRGQVNGIPPASRPNHAADVAAQIQAGVVRYRPLEVAAATGSDAIPVHFMDAVSLGQRLLPRLAHAGRTPPHLR